MLQAIQATFFEAELSHFHKERSKLSRSIETPLALAATASRGCLDVLPLFDDYRSLSLSAEYAINNSLRCKH
jgi:hypothetical protein